MVIDDASTYTLGHCLGGFWTSMTVNGVGRGSRGEDQVRMDS